MQSKIYRADSMRQAVAGLREDLGIDAVILETRTVRQPGFRGWMGRTYVEVRASTAEAARASRMPSTPSITSQQDTAPAEVVSEPRGGAVPDRDATRRMAQAMLEELEAEPRGEPKPGPFQADVVRGELGELRDLVGQVLRNQTIKLQDNSVPVGVPEEMVTWYLELVATEVSPALATQVIEAACQELAGCFEDRAHVRECVIHHLSCHVPTACSPLPEKPLDGPLIIAMVGPTGVGKTTTTAKIAATCRLHRGDRVALMTCDTYRVAAVQQLRTYADILGMTLHVVERPEMMSEALAALSDVDVVIIDTPGRGQRDQDRLDELDGFLKAAQPHQVHLVLSGTAGEKVLLREAEAFLPLGVDRIVLTKLDEAVSFGMLIEVLHRIGRSLSFVTTGQEVPADIQPASGDHLATLALGGVIGEGTLWSCQR